MQPHKISKQAWMASAETEKLMAALCAGGGDARFAGGCVRDALANRKTADIDIATPLPPDDVIARLDAAGIKHAPTGLKHGTVTAIVDGKTFEVTTLRIDAATYGRHADVTFTEDWRKDAARRDFTINAMFADRDGNVYDYFGGVADLREGRVLFVGEPEQRIKEDVLRILRFFRFHAFFGKGAMDAQALAACIANAKLLPRLSAERIRQETLRLLESQNCVHVWHEMLTQGVVTHFLPEATGIKTLENLVKLEIEHESDTFVLRRLAALLDVTAEGLETVVQQLRLSNEQSAQLKDMVQPPYKIPAHMKETDVRALVYRAGNDMARSLLLLAAAKDGAGRMFDNFYDVATRFRAPRFPIEGKDVLDLGIKPGPEVGDALKTLEDWWIREDFRPGRSECLQKLQTLAKP